MTRIAIVWRAAVVACLLAVNGAGALANEDGEAPCSGVLVGEYRQLASQTKTDLCEAFHDRLVLIVNTASQCGFVGQFEGLETLYQRYQDRGLVVIGFPSDDFNQEHADEAQTSEVCRLNYGVSFPMMATTNVTGDNANPLFQKLNAASEAPGWNFNKYLVDPKTGTVAHFGARSEPLGGELEALIQSRLSE